MCWFVGDEGGVGKTLMSKVWSLLALQKGRQELMSQQLVEKWRWPTKQQGVRSDVCRLRPCGGVYQASADSAGWWLHCMSSMGEQGMQIKQMIP